MSQEHSEWLASLPPAEREALNKGLSALETMADLWAVEINLGKMSETIAGAPDLKKRAFAIKSMVEQGFIEGAYRTYLDYKDGKLPGQSARPEALRSGWQPIETAPRTGEHVLIAKFDGGTGFGSIAGKHQPMQVVAHWFEYGKVGFYGSVYGGDQTEPFDGFTHWQSLPSIPSPPRQLGSGNLTTPPIWDPCVALCRECKSDGICMKKNPHHAPKPQGDADK